MSKQPIIIAAVLGVLTLGGVVAFMQMQKPAPKPVEVAEQNVQQAPENTSQKGTIQSLIAAGKNVVCEINMGDQGGSGTTYVSGNKLRGDFTVQIENNPMATHMVSDGEYLYMWTDGSTQGTKFKIDPETQKKVATSSGQASVTDFEKEVDLKCTAWTIDNSKFTVPTDVKFTDLSQTINNAIKNQPGSSLPKVDKSICDQIPDPEGKASCLKTLGN